MNQNKNAVIIGSGVGGLATAVFLAQNGYKVEIYEKNSNPGGRCGQMEREGHRFDLGASILLMPSIYRTVFSAMGIDMDKELEAVLLKEGKEVLADLVILPKKILCDNVQILQQIDLFYDHQSLIKTRKIINYGILY